MKGFPFQKEEKDLIKEKVLKYILEKRCTLAVACEKAGVGYNTAWEWRKVDAEWQSAVRDALMQRDEAVGDLAESMLAQNIRQGKERSIEFFLKTKMKRRGYIPAAEVDHTSGGEKIVWGLNIGGAVPLEVTQELQLETKSDE